MAAIGWIIVPLSAVLVGLSVALVVPIAINGFGSALRTAQIRSQIARSGRLRELSSADVQIKTGTLQLLGDDLCRNGIRPIRPVANFLLKFKLINQKIALIVQALRARIEGICPEAVCESLTLASVLLALVMYLLFNQWLLSIVSMAAPLMICSMQAERWTVRQQELLREQLPDALRALGMCFSAGFSLQQALQQTARETAQPLQGELSRTTHDMQTGCSVLEALANLEQRTSLPDLQFVSVAMEIQHTTGGSLREILDSAADSINATFELHRSMQVQTAQAKISARVVSVMPLLLMLVLSIAMEGYLETFFSSLPGFMLLVCALGMELAGIMIIRKILGLNLN